MKILRYFIICFFALSLTKGNGVEIKKGGEKPTTFTYDEALEMLKARDAQWEGKLAKADTLIEDYKVMLSESDELIEELQKYAEVEKVLSEAKSKQITLLKEREKTNEELIKTLQPKWYENTYLWLGIGFILGKIQ